MARSSVPLAFPTWRDLWASLDRVPELLAAADAALQRRAAGNQRLPIPHWDSRVMGDDLTLAIRASREWAGGQPPRNPATRPAIAGRIHAVVNPLLRMVAWPRWLFLERALLDASATGDLLFAALVLRTMCEEALRLHSLDIDGERLVRLAGSSVPADQEQVIVFFSIAWASLDDLPQEMVLDGVGWPSPPRTATPRLDKVRVALNSYVHPNYGSHIAALFPEGASTARLLLEAVAAVYEAFFALSWAEERVVGETARVGIGALESWPHSVQQLQSQTLPEVQRTAENPAVAEAMKVPALIGWLTNERDDLSTMLRSPAAAPLVKDLPQRATSAAQGGLEYRMWEGASAIDVLGLASARRVEERLGVEFPSGAPDSSDQIRWLHFNALSLQLAMLIDQAKAAAFKTQLVRQITQGNCLGMLLCVRSLIEHRAFAIWLPKEVGVSLDALASEVQAANPLPRNAAKVEESLATFLAAQAKASKEQQRSWVMVERGGVRTARPNLGRIVDEAFPEDDRFRTLYALSSAAMHGRSGRGSELMLGGENIAMQTRRIGLLVLERICGRDEEMDHLSAALVQSVRLGHTADFGGTSAASTDVMAKGAFGLLDRPFVLGVDYSGDGTAESPFCLNPHLEFFLASYALLKQLGVDVITCPRIAGRDATGNLCDRWRAPIRDYWFSRRPLRAHG